MPCANPYVFQEKVAFATGFRMVFEWFSTGLRLVFDWGKRRVSAQVSKFGFPYHAKAMKRDRERR